MAQSYVLERAELGDRWDDFVRSSPNGTLFSYSKFLAGVRANIAVYYCFNNKELRAGIVLIEDEARTSAVLHDFVIHHGILFAKPQAMQNHSQILSEHFKIMTFIAGELPRRYKNIQMSLHPLVVDIRPFLWLNYREDAPRYTFKVFYTSHADIEDFSRAKALEDISLYNKASIARRQEIRYGIRDGVTTREEFAPESFGDFYAMTMKRQNIEVHKTYVDDMNALIAALYEAKLGRMFVSYTRDGKLGSAAFMGMDHQRAYYLFGANNPGLRNSHTGTAVLWDSFYFLSRSGVKEVDFEGINSPHRGWFKLSFGGNIIPYFHVYFNDENN